MQAVKRIIASDEEFRDPGSWRDALEVAIQPGNLALIEYLHTLGWLEVCREGGQFRPCYPLHILASRKDKSDTQMMSFFTSNAFDVNAFNTRHRTPLQTAALNANFEVVKFLCEQGADPNLTYRAPNGSSYPTILESAKRSLTGQFYDTPEATRHRNNLIKIVDYLESGQCKKQ